MLLTVLKIAINLGAWTASISLWVYFAFAIQRGWDQFHFSISATANIEISINHIYEAVSENTNIQTKAIWAKKAQKTLKK